MACVCHVPLAGTPGVFDRLEDSGSRFWVSSTVHSYAGEDESSASRKLLKPDGSFPKFGTETVCFVLQLMFGIPEGGIGSFTVPGNRMGKAYESSAKFSRSLTAFLRRSPAGCGDPGRDRPPAA